VHRLEAGHVTGKPNPLKNVTRTQGSLATWNDNRFNENSAFGTAANFAEYMIDCFNTLYQEGATSPRLMTVGLHDRLIGRPGPAPGLVRSSMYANTTVSGSAPGETSLIIGGRPMGFRDNSSRTCSLWQSL
jgi:hypothetical protein